MLIRKEHSIEKNDTNIKDTMNWKVKQIKDNNLPIESGLADYINLGINNIEEKIKQLKNYKTLLEKEIKDTELHKLKVSEDIAEWLNENGIQQIKGIECSSITINKGSEAKEEKIKKLEFRTKLSQLDIEDFLIKNGLGEYVEVETVKITPQTKDKIKINKKRK